MRTCRSCGRESPDDADFCTCGEYLRWDPTNYLPSVKGPTSEPAAGDRATAPANPDPSMTVAPDAVAPGRAWAEATAGTGAPAPGMPGSGDAPPGAAALMLRLPDEDGPSRGIVSVSVEPGQRATILGLIRNQSEVVDNLDLSLRGLPEDWFTITPATAYLVPYGTSGTYEQEFQIHIHPPRSPQAQARPWSFLVVAVSRAYGGEVASAPASVTIRPYFDVTTELRPERATGRLKARYRLIVRNKANARTEVAISAEDTDAECQFRFAEPRVAIEPGNAMECPFTVFPPRQIWLGKSLDRRFQVTVAPIGVDVEQPPRTAVYRQRSWLPGWLAVVGAAALALAVVAIKLLPKQTLVPNLKGQPSVFAAELKLSKVGLKLAPSKPATEVDPSKPAGSIAAQIPAAGTKAKRGATVTVVVYAGTGRVTVPSVVGDEPGEADQALRSVSLALGAVSPQPLNPNGKIYSQIPLAGATVPAGTAVAVFLAAPTVATTTGTTTTPTTTTSATTTTASTTTTSANTTTASTTTGSGTSTTPATTTTSADNTTTTTTTSADNTTTTTTSTTGAGPTAGAGPAAAGAVASLAVVAAEAGKGPIAIPALTGDPTAAAAQLSQLGLSPHPVTELATVPAGDVAGTVPAAGAKVAKGAQIDLLISDGSPQLSYNNGSSVRVINPSTLKRSGTVPPGAGPQVEASWSPDGTELIYSQNGQLVTVQPNVKGAVPTQLTAPQSGVTDLNPAFAPTLTAQIIAFIQQTATGTQLCFATIGKFALNADCTSPPTGWDLGGEVDWSPDGSTILVLGTTNGGANFGLLAFTSNVPFSTQASNWGHGTLQTDDSVAGTGVFAGEFSPNGKKMALVAGSVSQGFNLYIVRAGDFAPTAAQELQIGEACQVAWRSDGKELAVMQPDGLCGPDATGTILGVDLADLHDLTPLATDAAHPAWQPVPASG